MPTGADGCRRVPTGADGTITSVLDCWLRRLLAELAFPLNLTFSLMEKELRGAGCAEGTFTAVLDCWLRRLLAELAFPLNLTFSLMEKE